jgi:hypothetical protein
MNVMDYTKCMHCSRIETLAHSASSDTKLYSDCWLCEDAAPFVVSEYPTLQKFNNNYVYGLFAFFLGIVLLYCNKFMDLYSTGWWILTVKGSVLIMLCLILLYAELSHGE